MDANRQRFWMIADPDQARDNTLAWDADRRVFRLRSHRAVSALPNDRTEASALANGLPIARDTYNTWAQPAADRLSIVAGGAGEGTETIYTAPTGWTVVDLALGSEGILFILIDDGAQAALVWLDRRRRFEPVQVDIAAARPDRLAVRPDGGCYLLDRSSGALLWGRGKPLPDRPTVNYTPSTARPVQENRDPPRVEPLPDVTLPAAHQAIAMTSTDSSDVAVLLWPDDTAADPVVARIHQGQVAEAVPLPEGGTPFDIAWVGEDLYATRHAGRREAVVYRLTEDEALVVGERYPINAGASTDRRFANALETPPHYPAGEGDALRLRPLHPLSMPALDRQGELRLAEPFDSGEPGTVWHRIYLEAKLPPGTSVTVRLSAADEVSGLPADPTAAHGFGAIESELRIPVGGWVDQPSELAYHEGLLPCDPEPNRAGLFTVLVQTSDTQVRDIKGRYLDVSLTMQGNGHVSPELAAVRIYGPRFSYRDRYLPALYRETLSGADALAVGDATGPDFLNRMLGLFEGFLTPLEDRIAASYLLTNPRTAPPEALDWLARWVGLAMESGIPEARKRRMLRHAGSVHQRRGTLRGLALALDMATDGAVANGQIVILEDFRLRRTFATILGADLTVENDPLLQADLPSANSYLGDTLFLGDAAEREFMSLFAAELELFRHEERAVARFHERLAHRLTVLVHHDTDADTLRLVRRVVGMEAPAHLVSRVLAAGEPLLIGLRSLVAVNTYLSDKPQPRPVRLGRSLIGRLDQVRRTPSLDPRLDSGG